MPSKTQFHQVMQCTDTEWMAGNSREPKLSEMTHGAREYGVDYIIVCMPTPESLIDSSFYTALLSSKAHLCSHNMCMCAYDLCVLLTTFFASNFCICLLSFDLPTLLCLFVLHAARGGLLVRIVYCP